MGATWIDLLDPTAEELREKAPRELEETAYWLELLLETDSALSDKLSAAYRECTELIAIFVTIVKHSRASDPS